MESLNRVQGRLRGFSPAKRRTGREADDAWRRRADEEKEPSRLSLADEILFVSNKVT